jgi:subtilisin family serine protease
LIVPSLLSGQVRWTVAFKPEYSHLTAAREWPETLGETAYKFGISNIRKAFPPSDGACLTTFCENLNNTVFFDVMETGKVPQLQRALMASDMLIWAEPLPLAQLAYTPVDPSFSSQTYLGLIQAPQAWDVQKGNTGIVIGMVDSGTDTLHEDLQTEYALNTADPYNGVDDDGDGYTDNFRGWNFALDNSNVSYSTNDHGVQMSGVAAAATDNGKGISGIGFYSRLMPVKVTDGSEVLFGFEGIKYAADKGCKVINCSWNFAQYSRFGEEVVNYATYEKDALVVAAAGNQGEDAAHFPAAYASVLGVANTDQADNLATNSNFGYYISLSAPGVNIYTTRSGSQYGINSGSSFSSAVVSGAAALLRAQFPSATATQIHARLKATSDNVYHKGSNSFRRDKLGAGRVNLYKAVSVVSPVWVDIVSVLPSDAKNEVFEGGDTLRFSITGVNRLSAMPGAMLFLNSFSPYLTVQNGSEAIGPLGSGDTLRSSDIFKVLVGAGAPVNHRAALQLTLVSGSDTIRYGYDVVLQPAFLDFNFNDIASALGARGTFGYYTYPQTLGQGVHYKGGAQLLYEGGLLVGWQSAGNNLVVDRLRGPMDLEQRDFLAAKPLTGDFGTDTLVIRGAFTDSGAVVSGRIGVHISQKLTAYKDKNHSGYFVIEYGISAIGTHTLTGIYAGLLADWDIGDYEKNRAKYDGQRYLAYTYPAAGVGEVAGIQLLSGADKWNCYSIDHIPGGAGGIDITDNDIFSKAEKFTSLTSTRERAGVTPDGSDVLQILSSGPHTLHSGDTLRLSWAVHVANNAQQLFIQADSAYLRAIGSLPLAVRVGAKMPECIVYPQPADEVLNIFTSDAPLKWSLRDLDGREVLKIQSPHNQVKMDVSALPSGIYILCGIYESGVVYRKIVCAR